MSYVDDSTANTILATLSDDIWKLREAAPTTPVLAAGFLKHRCEEIANDLAMLHALIEARKDQFEQDLAEFAAEDDPSFRTDELADEDRIAEVIALNDRAEFAEARAMGARPPFYRPRGSA